MKRIGLYGGSFDPVHLGHLLVAQAAREEWNLERLFFIPAAHSPFKPETKPTPPATRLQLLRLALAGNTTAEIDEQEIKRGGISYTIETALWYRQKFPATKLYYLIGTDHVAHLPKWKEAGQLAELLDFLIIPRPGEAETTIPDPFRGNFLRGFPLGVSSSQIRERASKGLPINHLVPPIVAESIQNNRLYL